MSPSKQIDQFWAPWTAFRMVMVYCIGAPSSFSIDRLLALYPDSDKAAAGNLKKALAFLEQNQVGQAIVQLRYVLATYPGTDEARIARDKLTSLGADSG